MSVERLDYLLKQGVRVPFVPNELTEFASKLVVMNLAWHADPDGYVWVSDRTQALELAMSRSTVWVARQLLVRDGWLINTGTRKQKGVGVFKLVIPGFSGLAIPTTKDTSGLDSGSTSGLASGSTSGLASGLASGSTSGLASGSPYQTKYEIKTNKNIEKVNNNFQKTENNIPKSVRERINQNKRSRGIFTENSETSIGEALKTVLSNLQPPNTDQQNNTES
jgi:hypothetical protein